ncbi:MAG TPA: hypothetical protein VHQ87_02835, partial [Rhizobacter sp.]|nr:hypothetical protein [Rhizobacter sp.]
LELVAALGIEHRQVTTLKHVFHSLLDLTGFGGAPNLTSLAAEEPRVQACAGLELDHIIEEPTNRSVTGA